MNPQYNAIIVGSGAAGVSAALALKNANTLVIDVGNNPPQISKDSLNVPYVQSRKNKEDQFSDLIGDNFESLNNIFNSYLSPKLKGPYMRYIIEKSHLLPVKTTSFDPMISFSKGGLANGWGAGVYRYSDLELKKFPIDLNDLNPFYDKLTEEIGISGINDDLSQFFGKPKNLLPSIKIDSISNILLNKYQKYRGKFNKNGIYIGLPHLAVSTSDYKDTPHHRYDGLECFKPNIRSVYSPSYTMDKLIKKNEITYLDKFLVKKYFENRNGTLTIIAKNLKTNQFEQFTSKSLVLAAGTLSTCKIVLKSNNDYQTKLPILDNPISFIPLVYPKRFGLPQDSNFYVGAQLNMVFREQKYDEPIQGSYYGVNGILKSDFATNLPLPIQSMIWASKYLASSISMIQLFYPDHPETKSNYLSLLENNSLNIHYVPKKLGNIEKKILRIFRRIGFIGHSLLCKFPAPGSSIHYAGGFPMMKNPKKYETYPNGQLFNSKNVFIADGANFSTLPSKPLTFTIMANSMRIAEQLKRSIK